MMPKKSNQTISDTFVNDVKSIIEYGRRQAYKAVGKSIIETYWKIGRRIVEEEQNGAERAQYGKHLLTQLSEKLQSDYGTSYSDRNLRSYRQFYLSFKNIEIWNELVPNLTWTHIRKVLPVSNDEARMWYLTQALLRVQIFFLKLLELVCKNLLKEEIYLMSKIMSKMMIQTLTKNSNSHIINVVIMSKIRITIQ